MSWNDLPTEIKRIIVIMTREMNDILHFQRFLALIYANLLFYT